MTKKLTRATSALLALLLLTGCGGGGDRVEKEPPAFARGVWDGDTYINEYASLSFTLPDGWEYNTNADLAIGMKIDAKAMPKRGEPFTEEVLALEEIADMQAIIPGTDNRVVVGYTNLARITGGIEFTEDDFLEYLKEQSMGRNGDSDSFFSDYNRVKTINGKKYTILEATYDEYAYSIYYMARRMGDYMLVVGITVSDWESVDYILECFS